MSLFSELKRRNVFRVAIAYALASWVVLQLADLVLEPTMAPDWILWLILGLLLLGFLFFTWLAWTYELTPHGLQRDETVKRAESIRRQTGRRLNVIIFSLGLIAIGLILVDYALDDEKHPIVDAHLRPRLSEELEERAERSREIIEAEAAEREAETAAEGD